MRIAGKCVFIFYDALNLVTLARMVLCVFHVLDERARKIAETSCASQTQIKNTVYNSSYGDATWDQL